MVITDTDLINGNIDINSPMSIDEIVKVEVDEWLDSEDRLNVITGNAYYRNKTDILEKTTKLKKRANIKRIHAYTKKLTDQKTGYLLSLPLTIATKNKTYQSYIDDIFNKDVLKLLRNTGKDSIISGVAWWQPYINSDGALKFKKHWPWEIKPLWEDSEHTKLAAVIRVYEVVEYVAHKKERVRKVDLIGKTGIRHYTYKYLSGQLVFDKAESHFTLSGKPWSWNRVPMIPWKYNDEEQSIVESIKSLIDDYDFQASKNSDLLADLAMVVWVLKGYGGTDLDEFIKNLEEYMAVNIESGDGGVDKIQAEPNTNAVEEVLNRTRQEIYEFGRGIDTQKEDLGNASGTAIRFRYGDLDMDCNILESEFQASLEEVEWFIKQYLYFSGKGNFLKEDAEVIFSRDIIINEKEIIEMCTMSKGIISDQTIRDNHPWTAEDEDERLEEERKKAIDEAGDYQKAFNPKVPDKPDGKKAGDIDDGE